MMLGAAPPAPAVRAAKLGGPALEVRDLSLAAADDHGVTLSRIALELRSGEILGVAGVSGNGPGGAAGRPLGRGPAGAGPQHSPLRSRRLGRVAPPAARPGAPLRPRGAHRSRLCARALAGREHAAHRRESVGAGGWLDRGRTRRWRRASSNASPSARAVPTRPLAACRAATCRSSSSGARSTRGPRSWWWRSRPGPRRRRGGADPPPDRGLVRRGRRRADHQRGPGGAVRALFRSGGDRARAAVTAGRGPRRQPGADRPVMSGLFTEGAPSAALPAVSGVEAHA